MVEQQHYVCEPCKKSFTSEERLAKHQTKCDKVKIVQLNALLTRKINDVFSLIDREIEASQNVSSLDGELKDALERIEQYEKETQELNMRCARLEGQVKAYRKIVKNKMVDE